MDMQDFANLGSAVLTGDPAYVGNIDKQALRARNQSNELRTLIAYALPTPDNMQTRIDGPIIGWTTPTLTYSKQRQINASALALNFDIEKNVKNNDAFKNAWNDWFKSWQTFFNNSQTTSGKLAVIVSMDTDLLAAQTESFRVQLVGDKAAGEVGWVAKYESLNLGASTAPTVPKIEPTPPGGPPPESWWAQLFGSKKPDQNGDTTEGVPWWLIALFVTGGVGLVAGSFFIIRRKVIESEQAEKFLRHDVLPIVLGGAMGPTGASFVHAANARFSENDPSGFISDR